MYAWWCEIGLYFVVVERRVTRRLFADVQDISDTSAAAASSNTLITGLQASKQASDLYTRRKSGRKDEINMTTVTVNMILKNN